MVFNLPVGNTLTPSQINARIKVRERPFAAPGKCIVCGAVDHPVVDFGFDIDRYGVVYFCVECLAEVAGAIDMVPKSLLKTNLKEVDKLVSVYLERYNVRVVTEEWYQNVMDHFSSISMLGNGFADLPESSAERSTQDAFDFDSNESIFKFADSGKPVKGTKQDDKTDAVVRSNDVPDFNIDGILGFS